MNRRGFLKVLGLTPLVAVGGPAMALVAPSREDRPFPSTEEEVRERLAEIEREVGVGRDGDTAYCPENDKVYKTLNWPLVRGLTKFKGQRPVLFPNEEAAWALWFAAFMEYYNARGGKIHWRQRPYIWGPSIGGDTWETRNDQKFVGYAVSARLVIDDK